jgi:hypothetical protein
MAALAVIGGIVSAVGTIASARASAAAGAQQQAQMEFKAKQEDQAAQQSRAASQREAIDQGKKTALTMSTLQARSAGDGGTSTDATPIALGESIAGQGEYNELGAMFRGEDRARGLEMQADGDRASGKAAADGAKASAFGTILSGAGSMFGKFGGSSAFG